MIPIWLPTAASPEFMVLEDAGAYPKMTFLY
jgi:hypothetical protein